MRERRAQHADRRRPQRGPAAGRGARAPVSAGLVRLPAAGTARSSVRGCSPMCRSGNCWPYIDWMPFFNAWEFSGKFPGDPRGPAARRRGHAAVRRCPAHAAAARPRALADARRRSSASFRRPRPATTSLVYADARRASACSPACTSCASRRRKPDGPAAAVPGRFRRAASRSVLADYIGAFAVTAGSRHRGARRALRGGARRLFGDPAEGARRPPRRGVRRGTARARAPRVLGLRAGRAARATSS